MDKIKTEMTDKLKDTTMIKTKNGCILIKFRQ